MSFIEKYKKYIPFLEQIPELKNKAVVRADIIAWTTVAIVLIPQAMAVASIAWLPAYIWLYTAFLPVIIWGIFSSSRLLSTWPVTVISLMVATTLAPFSLNESEYIMYAAILAIMIWVMQVILWIFKLWSIFNFLSHAVIVWFINAAAVIILFSQLKNIFWIELESWLWVFQTIVALFEKIPTHTHIYTFLFWTWAIALIYLFRVFLPKLPSFLFVVPIAILASYFIWYENLGWVVVWTIPAWLPSLYIPDFKLEILLQLLPWALILWFLWFTEAISIAKAMWLETKRSVSTNQMLFSEWFANISSWFSNWYPVSWTFSRSAVNLRAGAQTQLSSIITWLIVAIVLIFLTVYLYHLPMAILAAILIVAVMGLVKVEPIIKAWKIQKHDAVIAVVTFLTTLAFSPHLEIWIFTWVFLSLVMHLYQSMKPRFSELSMAKDWAYRDAKLHNLETSKKVWIYKFYGKLFFVNIWYFEEKLLKYIESSPNIKVVVIDFSMINYIDSSAMEVLENLIHSMKKYNIDIYFTWVHSNLWKQFKSIWYLEEFWKHNIFPNVDDVVDHLKENKKDLDLKPLLKYSPIKKEQ